MFLFKYIFWLAEELVLTKRGDVEIKFNIYNVALIMDFLALRFLFQISKGNVNEYSA